MAAHPSILTWEISWTGAWQTTVHGVTESDTTEWLTHTELHTEERILLYVNKNAFLRENYIS